MARETVRTTVRRKTCFLTIQHFREGPRSTASAYVQRSHLTSLRHQPQPTCRADCVGFRIVILFQQVERFCQTGKIGQGKTFTAA